MREDNPSELGPWREEDDNNNNFKLKILSEQQPSSPPKKKIVLPKVENKNSRVLIIKPNKTKDESNAKVKPIEISPAFKEEKFEGLEYEGYQSKTISFDRKMNMLGDEEKIEKIKKQYLLEIKKLECGSEKIEKRSKISLINFSVNEDIQKKSTHYRNFSLKLTEPRTSRKQFNKKEERTTIKNEMKPQEIFSSRKSHIDKSNEKKSLNEYSFINMFFQAEQRYIPYFESRKSHYSLSGKRNESERYT